MTGDVPPGPASASVMARRDGPLPHTWPLTRCKVRMASHASSGSGSAARLGQMAGEQGLRA